MTSFFQYIGSLLIGTVVFFSLFFVERHPTILAALGGATVSIVFLALVYLFVHSLHPRRYELFVYSLILGISVFGLISVMEVGFIRFFLMVTLSLALGLIYGWGIVGTGGVFVTEKPVRRFFMMALIFALFSLATVYFAVGILGVAPPGVLVLLFNTTILSVVFGAVVMLIWRLYQGTPLRSFVFWGGCVALLVFELSLVIRLLPLGYVVSGFLLTWIVYIVQLLTRFHLTDKGILWKEQRLFLILNAALFTLFLLFYVRWV